MISPRDLSTTIQGKTTLFCENLETVKLEAQNLDAIIQTKALQKVMPIKEHLAVEIKDQLAIVTKGQMAMATEEMGVIRALLMPESRLQVVEDLILIKENRMDLVVHLVDLDLDAPVEIWTHVLMLVYQLKRLLLMELVLQFAQTDVNKKKINH